MFKVTCLKPLQCLDWLINKCVRSYVSGIYVSSKLQCGWRGVTVSNFIDIPVFTYQNPSFYTKYFSEYTRIVLFKECSLSLISVKNPNSPWDERNVLFTCVAQQGLPLTVVPEIKNRFFKTFFLLEVVF